MTIIAIFGLALISNAQVPNYVPSNGLVGWWPFNGNANDESLNGNNGLVNGATLTNDRFGNNNSAYNFTSDAENINCGNSPSLGLTTNSSLTISYWTISSNNKWPFISKYQNNVASNSNFAVGNASPNFLVSGNGQNNFYMSTALPNTWVHLCFVYNGSIDSVSVYLNGNFIQTNNIFLANNISTSALLFGPRFNPTTPYQIPNGNLDDIGIWNRALTQEEISNLHNTTNCSNNLTISPASNQLQTGNTATFLATTSDANPNFVWQSDFGQGFQTLNNYGNYSGVNSNSLSISNVQLANHALPIRVISTSGECIDTSNVATINITDTCIVTINDTITTLISVTDTLVINTLITGLTPPNNSNTIKVFPNPANSHITIDFGNFASMNGYILKITNSIGQIVFTTPINQQSSYVNLSTWGGNGIYFVQIIDTQNNTIENRKIVLQ